MIIQVMIIILLCLFYISYFAKMLLLKKQGISADLLGKGNKPKKAVLIEIILKSVTYIGAVIQFVSALFANIICSFTAPLPLRVIGIVLVAIGTIFFLLSVTIMRSNWRAGFDIKQNTTLVTKGIYKISRNPAFVGFNLLYVGCSLAVSNVFIILITLVAIVAFHIQILGKEKFLTEKFGQEYIEYRSKVRRYF
jgi:protein-S-isoprenylcysteine O-methyltransferase Ste14